MLILAATVMLSPQIAGKNPTGIPSEIKKGFWSIRVDVPVPAGSDLERFAERQVLESATARIAQFKQSISPDGKKPPFEGSLQLSYKPGLVNASVVSGVLTQFAFTGGAHPNTNYAFFNFVESGRGPVALKLQDVLSPGVRSQDVLDTLVMAELNEIKAKRKLDAVTKIPGEYADRFVVESAGVTWVFEPYSMGPYSEGTYRVTVPWQALRAVLNPSGPLRSVSAAPPKPAAKPDPKPEMKPATAPSTVTPPPIPPDAVVPPLEPAPKPKPTEKPAAKPEVKPAEKPAEKPLQKPVAKPTPPPIPKDAVVPPLKPAPKPKPAETPPTKPVEKPAPKPAEKPVAKPTPPPIPKDAVVPPLKPAPKPNPAPKPKPTETKPANPPRNAEPPGRLPDVDPDADPIVDPRFQGAEPLVLSNKTLLMGSTLGLAGNLVWREKIAVPKGSTVTFFATQLNLGRYVTSMKSFTVSKPGSPVPFSVELDLSSFNKSTPLSITIQVVSPTGVKLFKTQAAVKVPREGWSEPKDIRLVRG